MCKLSYQKTFFLLKPNQNGTYIRVDMLMSDMSLKTGFNK